MFKDQTFDTIENIPKPEFNPGSLSNMSTEEILSTLKIEQPKKEEINNFESYMGLQAKVMQTLIDKLGNQEEAMDLFQNKLSEKFRIEYRHGF